VLWAVQRQQLRTGCNDLCVVSMFHLLAFCLVLRCNLGGPSYQASVHETLML
jgi:hypothetical protein